MSIDVREAAGRVDLFLRQRAEHRARYERVAPGRNKAPDFIIAEYGRLSVTDLTVLADHVLGEQAS